MLFLLQQGSGNEMTKAIGSMKAANKTMRKKMLFAFLVL